MFMIVPAWLVVTKDFQFRVPESDLEGFTRVLLFNKMEFQVSKPKDDPGYFAGEQTVEASNHAACKDCPGCTDANCGCTSCQGRCAL